ncbi:MAG: alpha/beta hydrolase [Pseudomonadota bacterium]
MKNAIHTPVDLAFETFGRPSDPCLVLLHGAAMQLVDWPSALLERLSRGFFLLVFDLRDSGASTKCGPCNDSGFATRWSDLTNGTGPIATYNLFDMADDVIRSLDRLGVVRAHFVGYSMGGMIAQILAARHGDRTLSLTSLMSSAGQAGIDCSAGVRRALVDAFTPFADLEHSVAELSQSYRAYYGAGQRADRDDIAERIRRAYRRCYCPNGVLRQLLAIQQTGARQDLLRGIDCPTLVVHGSEDACIDVAWAEAMSSVIPDCDFRVIPGLGHEFTDQSTSLIARLVAEHCGAAERSRPQLLDGGKAYV